MSIFSFIFFLLACSSKITEEDFVAQYSQEICARIFSCVAEEDQTALEDIYGSQEACAEGIKAELESNIDSETLEYDAKQGAKCIEYLQGLDCSETDPETDPCSNVYLLIQD